MNSARLKSQICAFLDEMSDLIIGLSQEIHSNPELSFQEYNAVKSICERMKNAGFEIEQNIGGLKTAFRAIHTAQSTGPTDAANVSQVVPLLHGRIAIAPAETKAHTEEFTKAASSAQGMRAMINAAKALAMTAIDVFSSENLFNQIKNRFLKGKGGDSSPEA
jgi:metal-dependent amidase/aminoacylase/carboxypeptidase family protein